MNKSLSIILGFIVAASVIAGAWWMMNKKSAAPQGIADVLTIETPLANSTVTSPLTVQGSARGMFYFEASFPVELQDANHNEIVVAPAQAQEEWMTENFVPFLGTLTFEKPTTKSGFLVFKKDNPSGLPEHDQKFELPIRFE